MTAEREYAPFRFVRRSLADPGSLAGDILAGGSPAALFRGVLGVHPMDAPSGRTARLGSDVFTTTSPSARTKLETILAGGGHLVSTGQQPSLFLGPLYTLYKTASAIKLATDLERSTGRPALAMFWVAADDHDWREIAGCRILAADESVSEFRVDPPAGHEARSVGAAGLPDSIGGEIDRLAESLGVGAAGAERAGNLDPIRDAYRPGRTMSEAFTAAMVQVFSSVDLALLDSSHPEVRRAANGLYREAARRPEDVIEAMALGRAGVQGAGHRVHLNPPEAGLQVFHDAGTHRKHVLVAADGFGVTGGEEWSGDSFLALLEREPGCFTPAAALRPVLESWLLPVAATVLGPGELAYWAHLQPLFTAFQVEMPTVAPRDSWLIIEARVDRLLDKLGVTPDIVDAGGDELRRRILDGRRPGGVADALADLGGQVGIHLEALAEVGDTELPGLRAAVGKTRHAVERALDDLRRLVDRRVAERESSSLKQARRLLANLAPEGASQERALGVAGYLGRYGSQLVERLAATDSRYIAGPRGQD
ncbi:MAG: bacillithiol biosynthesis cysteine-adding enzyme BshC [Gemmatimonadota bacterium]